MAISLQYMDNLRVVAMLAKRWLIMHMVSAVARANGLDGFPALVRRLRRGMFFCELRGQ